MPESVTDRCTKSHEYIFLLSKSPKYHFDNEAIKEDSVRDWANTGGSILGNTDWHENARGHKNWKGERDADTTKRNKRSVWTVTTKPFSEAQLCYLP